MQLLMHITKNSRLTLKQQQLNQKQMQLLLLKQQQMQML
jgi:hypothetical protein